MKNLPDKIYLQVCGDCNANDCENCKFEDLEDNVTWCGTLQSLGLSVNTDSND